MTPSMLPGLLLTLSTMLFGVPYLLAQQPASQPARLTEKTLVVWVSPENLSQRGGSVLTIDDNAFHFDGIVFGELEPARWMAGSDLFRRTQRDQTKFPQESIFGVKLVQIAIVYSDKTITTFRNGDVYSRHNIDGPQSFPDGSVVVIGPRHIGSQDFFAGQIDDARIYNTALTAEHLKALKPGVVGDLRPWAWWNFDDGDATEKTGRFSQTNLTWGAVVKDGRLILDGKMGALFAAADRGVVELLVSQKQRLGNVRIQPPEDLILNYHLMHPGDDSLPGDPNAAFFVDGVYHLHYIIQHPWNGGRSFSFAHVTSTDMLHWTWLTTKLQPAFTGHGMFSGTGFLTKEGRPAAIYHGQNSGRNQVAIATDNRISAWEKPFPVNVRHPDGSEVQMNHWDPDCFLIGDTYYAISGGENPPLMKSKDLKTWTVVGPFLKHDLPDVAKGEDVSCPNLFRIGDKWMLLCISHDLGCRYYIGDWDEKAEQFVPESHGRMNWRRETQSLFSRESWRADFFAPESVLTPDGRRVMWAWCATLDRYDGHMSDLTIQSLPRELSLANDHSLRIRPLRELESLRHDPVVSENVNIAHVDRTLLADRTPKGKKIVDLTSDSMEVQITISRSEALGKLFGFTVYSDGNGNGMPIVFRPETGTLRVGSAEAPFCISDLPADEDVVLRIYIDRYVVEVFVNDVQAMIAHHRDYQGKVDLTAFTIGSPTVLKKIETWQIRPTNEGFRKAMADRVWEPQTRDELVR
jgi:beta-fructofuranosidase